MPQQVSATTTWTDHSERKAEIQSTRSSLVEIIPCKSNGFCLKDYSKGSFIATSPVCPVFPSAELPCNLTTLHDRHYFAMSGAEANNSILITVVQSTPFISMATVSPSHTVHTSSVYMAVSQFTDSSLMPKRSDIAKFRRHRIPPHLQLFLCTLSLVARTAVLLVRR